MINHYQKIKNCKVLVTGGLGFVGHNLVKELVNKYQCDVIVVDDCSNSYPEVLGDDLKKVNFQQLSVLDSKKLFPLFKGVDYIFHLACKQISSSGKEPHLHLKVNAESTLDILEFIRNNKLPNLKRFVYTSSTSIYGSSVKLPISEDDPTLVLSGYAATKLLGENYTLMYNRNYDIPTSSVRYSNVYGPGQSPTNPYCGVLGKFIHSALKKEPLNIFGDGEQTRDYTYIDDAVSATILAAVHPRAYGDVFNVGTSVETSVNELAVLIENNLEKLTIKYVDERDIDNIRRRSIDITKIHNNLSWSPKTNMKTGIHLTINWYRDFLKKSK
ncbi:MAG: NAD-dependent epimerase/dehydratase family protein [Flavobacteriales bacterium]|nr:NAD-dependent epimerase/dehydratase family protein [Flavobacteriales bacterium]MCB9499658.1 NAD-dependent epimerase/dehydratase family protein [Erysipelotrichaceae bacterium]